MMKVVVVSPEEFASKAADMVENVVRGTERPNLCFPTGDTPNGLYKELILRYQAGELSLANIRAFGLDEWGELEPSHPVRCSSRMKELLYNPTDITPDSIYFPEPTASDIEQECKNYDALIGRMGGLDLSILGIGMNGHIGFNEPGSKKNERTRVVRLDDKTLSVATKYGFAKTPTWGLTLGLATIFESKELLILVNGEHKADIVNRVVNGPVTEEIPATLLRDHPNCILLADSKAASLL